MKIITVLNKSSLFLMFTLIGVFSSACVPNKKIDTSGLGSTSSVSSTAAPA